MKILKTKKGKVKTNDRLKMMGLFTKTIKKLCGKIIRITNKVSQLCIGQI